MADPTPTDDLILDDAELEAIRAQLRAAWARAGRDPEALPESVQQQAEPDPGATVFAEPHTGLLVAAWLDPETAAALAVAGGEPAEQLHVTLCYTPAPAGGWDELTVARALAAIERASYGTPALRGQAAGTGRFLANPTSDGQDVWYASVDMPGLAELRQAVYGELCMAGVEPSSAHGYTPHITLSYLDPDTPSPGELTAPVDLAFAALTVMVGEARRVEIPLATPQLALYAVRDGGERPVLHTYLPVTFAEVPEWGPFLPVPGTYHHPIYGTLDYTTAYYEELIANFKAGVYQDRLPVNAEHDPQSSGAVGWITDMRLAESGAIEVKVEWNERGRKLLEEERYRYVSAEIYPGWADPVNPELIYDVAIGMAITTHPYFKERVLPPLAASEAVLTRDAGETGKEHDMGNSEPQVQTEQTPETPAVPSAPKQPEEMTPLEMNEQVLREFRELQAKVTEQQRTITKLSEANATLVKDGHRKAFTDEVKGRSDGNATPWLGDVEQHVAMLCDLAETFGTDSERVRQYIDQNRAHAERMKVSDLFRKFGTGLAPEGSIQAKIDAAASQLMSQRPELSRPQAVTEVLKQNPQLYADYNAGR